MPGADSLIRYLNETGIRTGVISNNGWSGDALRDRFDRLLPENRFEFILSSADYMIRKPDRRLFEVALLKADLPPEKVWFCGDSYEKDVVGARSAGIFPVWYEDGRVDHSPANSRQEACAEDPPLLHITGWMQMIELLKTL